jgi:FSR family fosmidomycin resistance protein-like MFS transporter
LNSHPIRRLYPVALGHLTIELCNNYLPVIYPILIATLGLSYAQVGFVTLVGTAGASLVQPLFGYLSDRWESRSIIISSVIWLAILMGLVGLTPNYWLLALLVGLGSLGSAAFHPAGASAIGTIATTRRGAILSVFSVSGALGTALSPLLITATISWLGLPGTMLLIPIGLLMALLLHRQSGWGGNAGRGSAPVEPQPAQCQPRPHSGSLVGLILVILAVMCRMLTALLIAISIGTLAGGILSDRIGRWQVLALSLGLLAPMQWFFATTNGPTQAGFVLLIGILLGASLPITIIMAQESWPRGVGLASALAMGLGWLPGGIGASTTGFVADQTSLAIALRWLAVAPAVGLACALLYALVWTRYSRMHTTPSI